MKAIFNNKKNTKINFEELSVKDNKENKVNTNINADNKINKNEFKNIFDLNKHSIKEIKEKVKALPKDKLESLKFNIEHSYFYLNVDIDKSFDIFKANILGKKINNDTKALVEEFVEKFISRIYELDKLIYVQYI